MKTYDFLDTFLNDGAGLDFGPGERAVDAGSADTIHVDTAALLFRGDYVRDGADLVISGGGERLVVHDYFGVPHRPKLVAPNGASLSDAVIEALAQPAHGVQVAQAGAPSVSDASSAIGRVQATTGTASVLRNGVSVTLHTGDLVYKSDVVQTDRASSLSISFLDGTLFSVAASARMVLNDMVYQAGGSDNHSLFNLVQGSVSFVAGQVAKTGDMKVGTPVATMGIRGTAVRTVIESDDGTSRLSVITEPPSEEYPNGHTGSFGVFGRSDPDRLLATVDDPATVLVVHPEGSSDVRIESVPKTQQEIAQENSLVQDMYRTQAEAPRLPVYTGPSTGGGTNSSTAPDLILPNPTPTPSSPGLPGVSEPGVPQPTGPTPPGTGPQLPQEPPSEPPQGQPGGPPLAEAVPGSAAQQAVAQAPPDGDTTASGGGQTAPAPAASGSEQTSSAAPQQAAATAPGSSALALAAQSGSVTQDGTLTRSGGQGVLAGTETGTQVIAAHAGSDPDSGLDNGSVTLTGRYGTLVLHADGTYVYQADKAAALAEGERGTDVFAITARSGAVTGTTTLSIDVTGVNDLPVLSAVQPVAVARAGGGASDSASGSVGFTDPDLTDLHTASIDGAPTVSRSSGSSVPAGLAASLAGALTARADDAEHRVDFSFAAADQTFSFLSAGETLTITYDLSVSDGHGGVAHTPVALTVTGTAQGTGASTGGGTSTGGGGTGGGGTGGGTSPGGGGTNRPPVLDGDHMVTVRQGDTVVVRTADLHATDPDNSAAQLTYTITQDTHGSFTLGTGSATVTTFTQADVDANRVVYHHDGTAPGSNAETVAFRLSDGSNSVTGTLAVTVTASGGPTANQDNVVRSADDQTNDLSIPTEALLFNDGSGAVSVANVVDRAPTSTSSHYVRSYSSSAVTVTGDANTHGDTGAFTYTAENAGGQSGSAATVYVNVTTGLANPTVFGQGEDDVLVASRYGNTTMISGAGHDVFVFTQDYTGITSMTTHVITDFSVPNDAIDLPYLATSSAGASNINDYVRVQGTEAGGFDLYVRSNTAFVYFSDVAHFSAGTIHAGDHVTVIWHDHAVQVTAALGGSLSV